MKLFSNMRHGQTPSLLYGSVDMSPHEMFFKLVDTPLGSTVKSTGGINKFLISFTHRLFYLTTKSLLGGDVSYGLQGYEFARIFTGIMQCPKYEAALKYSEPKKPSFPNGTSYLDIDTWVVQNSCMADWYGGLMQSAFAQEIKAVIGHLAFIYGASLFIHHS